MLIKFFFMKVFHSKSTRLRRARNVSSLRIYFSTWLKKIVEISLMVAAIENENENRLVDWNFHVMLLAECLECLETFETWSGYLLAASMLFQELSKVSIGFLSASMEKRAWKGKSISILPSSHTMVKTRRESELSSTIQFLLLVTCFIDWRML